MQCPYCEYSETRVIDSRDTPAGIRRRRECLRCGLRFTTQERLQTTALLVVKRDGRREGFDRDKARKGLLQACAKRPVSVVDIEKLGDEIERDLAGLNRAEIPSSLIGQMIMERLRRLDHVAYVRFASVYRNFQDVERFTQEVEALMGAKAVDANNSEAHPELQAQFSLPFNEDMHKTRRRSSPRGRTSINRDTLAPSTEKTVEEN